MDREKASKQWIERKREHWIDRKRNKEKEKKLNRDKKRKIVREQKKWTERKRENGRGKNNKPLEKVNKFIHKSITMKNSKMIDT